MPYKTREERLKYNRNYYIKNRERLLKQCSDYSKDNRQGRKDRIRLYERRRRYNLKLDIIEGYGSKCSCCGESTIEFLSIDHVKGIGRAARIKEGSSYKLYRLLKEKGYPKEDHRLLCFNCNLSMGFFGYCPHTIHNIEKTREKFITEGKTTI